MSGESRPRRASDEGVRARERLQVARVEESHASDRYHAAGSGSEEMKAGIELLEANEQTAAREAWVKWLERDY